MTHDPYQTHPTFGAYSGLTNPFSPINPAMSWATPQGYGNPFYGGISPQQLQLASALAAQSAQMFGASPFLGGLQQQAYNPFAQVGFAQQPNLAQQPNFAQPFAQPNLAPQSWVGQGQAAGQFGGGFGGVQGQGQIHPLLLQAVARVIQQTQGFSPWAAY